MVDFQSRDTRRDLGGEDDADDEEKEAEEEPTDDERADDGPTEGEAPAEAPEPATDPDGEAATGAERDGRHDTEDPHGSDADQDHHDENTDHDHDTDHDHHADHHAHDPETVRVGVLTISSSRSLADDPAGDAIATVLDAADHEVATRELVGDEYDAIQGSLSHLVDRRDVDAVVTTGGTGVTPDDVTVEAARQLFEKELPGFGELFRLLSYDEIGSRMITTRATAGVVEGVPIFCLPGSSAAVRLGTERIVAPEVDHLVGLANRGEE